MWNIITKLLSILADEDIVESFLAKLESSDKLIAKVFKAARAAKRVIDKVKYLASLPEHILNAAYRLPRKAFDSFIKSKMGKLKDIYADMGDRKKIIDEFSKKLRDEKMGIKKDTDKAWDDYINDKSIHKLSSSWIKYGMFHSNKQGIGVLTIWINSDNYGKWYGPYTYPGVSLDLWLKMRYCQGKNGSGAGSMFWKYFLRGWMISGLRTAAYNHLGKIDSGSKSERLENMINRMNTLNKTYWNKKNAGANWKKTYSQHDNRFYKLKLQKQVALTKNQAYAPYRELRDKWSANIKLSKELAAKRSKVSSQIKSVREFKTKVDATRKVFRDIANFKINADFSAWKRRTTNKKKRT